MLSVNFGENKMPSVFLSLVLTYRNLYAYERNTLSLKLYQKLGEKVAYISWLHETLGTEWRQ